MKNLFLTVLVVCLLSYPLFQACTPTSVEPYPVNTQLVMEVENLSQDLVWIGYNKLNPSEKVVFWNRHMDTYLNDVTLSADLKNHILELKRILTEERFEKAGTEENEQFMDAFEKKWFHEPVQQGRFSRETLFEIGTLFGFGTKVDAKGAKTSIFSFPGQTVKCTCRYSMSCPSAKYCFDKRNCGSDTPTNCGLLGTSRCTGLCE